MLANFAPLRAAIHKIYAELQLNMTPRPVNDRPASKKHELMGAFVRCLYSKYVDNEISTDDATE